MLTDQLSTEALGVLLHAAGAVSGVVDTPPCRFEVNGHLIDVYIDGAHLLPANDPTARTRRIATGGAIFNLRCAAASLSFDSWVSICPYPYDPDLAARIVVEPTGLPDQELRRLYGAILSRHLPRPPGFPDRTVRTALTRAAEIETAKLTWLPRSLADLATLSTDRDEPADQVVLGIARQRVLLTSLAHDVQAMCLHQTLMRFGREPGEAARTDDR
ncbi:hypothetical protein OG558_23385 [Kribbella sp. NBC_01510]|uniref:hypothetical protein n=1 Tax=Kribbella sp. NBC_01510 TaxID=2903581 RepID=UPI0038680938